MALARALDDVEVQAWQRAEFWAQRALGVDPHNIQAMRVIAQSEEGQDHADGLDWRVRVAQLNPGNPADIMAWAKSALRFEQPEMAMKALDSLPRSFRDRSAEYHELLAGFALTNHRAAVAEQEFIAAQKLDPQNPVNTVNLEAFRAENAVKPEARAAAVRDLQAALEDARVSLVAARALLTYALQTGDHPAAAKYSATLRAMRDHTFTDELNCLEVLAGGPDFQKRLTELEAAAARDPELAAAMSDWLIAHGMAAEGQRWIAKLPAPLRASVKVQISAAEGLMAMKDWTALAASLASRQWGGGDFLRRAMLVRCKRELGQPWHDDWEKLLAGIHSPDDLLLARVTIGWGWRPETVEVLWAAASRPESSVQALQYLWSLSSQTRDTREMQRVASQQLSQNPDNPAFQNNMAFLSMLLFGPSAESERLAQEAAASDPAAPEWKATYAYALHLAGREADALHEIKSLPAADLAQPEVALYDGIILTANGDAAGARAATAKLNAMALLPEEQKLAANLAVRLSGTTQ
jgi:predicted Zn-dependent protease